MTDSMKKRNPSCTRTVGNKVTDLQDSLSNQNCQNGGVSGHFGHRGLMETQRR